MDSALTLYPTWFPLPNTNVGIPCGIYHPLVLIKCLISSYHKSPPPLLKEFTFQVEVCIGEDRNIILN